MVGSVPVITPIALVPLELAGLLRLLACIVAPAPLSGGG